MQKRKKRARKRQVYKLTEISPENETHPISIHVGEDLLKGWFALVEVKDPTLEKVYLGGKDGS